MAIAPVTPQSAALQQAATSFGNTPLNVSPFGSSGMSPGATITPPAGAITQNPSASAPGSERTMKSSAPPMYQEQTYGGGQSYSKGMYGEDRATPETSYARLPGNDSVYSEGGEGYRNPFLGNDRFGNTQPGSPGSRPWEVTGNAGNNGGNVGGDDAGNAGGYFNSENTTDEFVEIDYGWGMASVPNPYYVRGGTEEDAAAADMAAQDANGDGRVSDQELLDWRPEDGRYGRGHGGRPLSQTGLNHLATYGVSPGADGSITDQQFADWANEHGTNKGGDEGGARAAYEQGGWDRDGNGVLSATELKSYQTQLRKDAIARRMAKNGWTEKQANDNLNSAIAQGADANSDGDVTDAEWSAWKAKNG